ncbi:MAG: hypothetical protein AAF483_01130 [Planctomycetota bacterium]
MLFSRPFAKSQWNVFACLIFAGFTSSCLRAQEAQIQILGVGDSEATESIAEGAMSFSFASPGSSFSLGSSLGGVDPNNRSQLFSLLSNESVRNELKLSEEQYAGAQKIMKESQKRMSKLLSAKLIASRQNGGPIQFGGGEFQEMMEENQKQSETAIEEILLPAQLERVQQLAYQIDVQQEGGMGDSLVNGRLGEEIGVYDDQKQNLVDKAAKIEAEAKAAILAIRTAARAKLFKELSPEQRKKAESLLGDYFQYEELSLSQQLRKSMRQVTEGQEEKEEPKTKIIRRR